MSSKTRTAVKVNATFRYNGRPGKRVFVAGTFNNWDSEKHQLEYSEEENCYILLIELPPGTYQYKFLVNGKWKIDPDNHEWALNGHGTLNSVVTV